MCRLRSDVKEVHWGNMRIRLNFSCVIFVAYSFLFVPSEAEGSLEIGNFPGRRFEIGEGGSEEKFGASSALGLSELGAARKKKKKRRRKERPLLARVTPSPRGSGWEVPFSGVQENFSPRSGRGWGWDERQAQLPVNFSPKNNGGWGWGEPPRDFCEDLSNRTITRVEDLEPEWRIVQVLSTRRRQEVNPGDLLDPPLKLVPFQINMEKSEDYKRTFYEEISVDFDEEAKNAGFSVTRNRFSTKRISTRTTGLDGENEGSVMRGAVSILKSLDRLVMPLRGNFDRNRYFREGLKRAKRAREMRRTTSPVESFWRSDLLFASEMFDSLKDFEREELEEEEEMPSLVSRVEKRTLPDVDHSERTVLDAEFNFGLPASNFEFESVDVLMEEWREIRRLRKQRRKKEETRKVSSSEEGGVGWVSGSSEETSRKLVSSEEFVRSRLKLHRTFGLESFVEAEERVQSEYVVSQFLICPTRTGNCTECPLDPPVLYPMLTDFKAGTGSGAVRPKASG